VLIQQQEQIAARQAQVTPFETSAPQMGLGLEPPAPQPSMGRGPEMNRISEMRSGIDFGPGRCQQGSRARHSRVRATDLQRVRGLGSKVRR
jgi:hypothetical protein